MYFTEFTLLSVAQVFKKLDTSKEGLSKDQVQKRLEKFGQNKLSLQESTWQKIFFRQFKSPFTYLLFVAFTLSLLLGEIIDAGMVLLFVAIGVGLGFYQEYRSEQTVRLLKKYLVSKIRVIRNGSEESIDVADLVPGDIMVLEPGDIIPVDTRFIESYNLSVDETILTGESAQVEKDSKELKSKATQVYKAANIGFSGTTVVSGKAVGAVFATGRNSYYASIVKLTSQTEKESSFEKELNRFSKFTLGVVLATLVFVVITSITIKKEPSLTELTLFSIALAVSVIPEALPVVTTFSLSIGALKLAKKHVVVKRLSAVEDLGGLQVLASDKTGTLTENKLTIDDILSTEPEKCIFWADLASQYSEVSRNQGNNAFDLAIREKLDSGLLQKLRDYTKLSEIPFDPTRRRITTQVKSFNEYYLVSRGAPEEVLSLSTNISEKEMVKLKKWISKKGSEGKRVLGVAFKKLNSSKTDLTSNEKNLEFLGLISFTDPIKPSAYEAVKLAKNLGVAVKILTGDSTEVAADVSLKIGLITDKDKVISGEDFEKLATSQKHAAVEDYSVFARITPDIKYEIIKLLEEKYSVGFLGEGINDAPALKAANVAVVVQGAADIAKEASDIVLLKRDLKVILEGISEGRKVFVNTSKYITATMASNFGNFFAVSFVSLVIPFLPMLPLQILLVNLLSDFPMIMVATDNVDPGVVRTPKRYSLKTFAFTAIVFGLVSTAFDFVFFGLFYPKGEGTLQTSWFIGSILTELLFLFSIRTRAFFLKSVKPSNILLALSGLAIFVTLLIPFTNFGTAVFGFLHPTKTNLIMVLMVVFGYFIATESVKLIYFKFSKSN